MAPVTEAETMSADCRCGVCTAEFQHNGMTVETRLRYIEKKIDVVANENKERLKLLRHDRDRLNRLIAAGTHDKI